MEMRKMSIHRRILFLLLFAGLVSFLALGAVSVFSMFDVQDHAMESGRRMGESVAGFTEEFAVQQARNRLMAIATEKAQRIERDISEIRNDAEYIARSMNEILAHPERRNPRRLPRPGDKPIAGGEAYFFYASGLSRQNAETELSEEIGLESNIAEDIEIMAGYYTEYQTSCYIGSKHGYLICADTIPREQEHVIFTEEFLSSFDPRERPWYKAAQKNDGAVMTEVYMGADGFAEITCASPYYDAEGFAGVAGISTSLESLYRQAMRNETNSGTLNFALNEKGEVVFSSATEGTLAATTEHRDVRQSEERSFALEAACMTQGLSDAALVTVDGVEYYLAYAPMPSIGWSLGTLIEKEAVVHPANAAKGIVLAQEEDFSASMRGFFMDNLCRMALLLALLLAAMFVGSRRAAERFVRPILALADGVREIAKGDLDRKLDVRTGDEIEGLADCVNEMTVDLKTYMENLARATEEKAHIATELSLAKGIQEGMLPNIFPKFAENPHFDLFASMEPAREVGGDFYDFYTLDDSHIALTMADVSGKGVPASLFMVISKTMLKNAALSEGSAVDLGRLMERTNRQLCENNEQMMFVTAFFGVLDLSTGEFVYVNAGHNEPLVGRARDGKMSWDYLHDGEKKRVLGVMENASFEEKRLTLAPGDMIFLYTDGVTEAADEEARLYSEERLAKTLDRAGTPDAKAKEILAAVRADIADHVGGAEQSDDITMMGIRFLG